MDEPDDIRDMIHSRRRTLRGRHEMLIEPLDPTSMASMQESSVTSSPIDQQRLLSFPDAASIRRRFEMQNFQSATLTREMSSPSATKPTSQDRFANPLDDLSNVSQKLDDAATKMQKTFSDAKTLVLLKD
jgi:hypothetical protein